MQEVYEVLLGHMKDHPILGKHLQSDVPNFSTLWTEAMPYLSSGEKILAEVALALYNGHGNARISDIFQVDKQNRGRIIHAITLRNEQLFRGD